MRVVPISIMSLLNRLLFLCGIFIRLLSNCAAETKSDRCRNRTGHSARTDGSGRIPATLHCAKSTGWMSSNQGAVRDL